MSLKTYFLHPDQFDRYYNCTAYDVDSIALDQRRHPFRAIVFCVLGVFYELIYLPCLYAIWKCSKKHAQQASCYRLMFLLGLSDVVGIMLTTFFVGYFTFQGFVFCSRPLLFYICCVAGTYLWVLATTTALILALNRCIVIYNPHTAERLFKGAMRISVWLLIPWTCSSLFCWFVPPVIYSSISSYFYFNPHQHYLPEEGHYSVVHWFYNWFVVVAIFTIYTIFATLFSKKYYAKGSTLRGNRKLLRELSTFLQVLVTCSFVTLAALCYVYQDYLQNFAFPAMIGYICYQGSPAIIYLCMNQSIRNILVNSCNALDIILSKARISNIWTTSNNNHHEGYISSTLN
uniref:G-protein coupled receptors family 1 profile domain-containing protein n=1 Tax=Ditylenchus dipsaci TaxID=166011 RepID=A0A915DWN2_9BILA